MGSLYALLGQEGVRWHSFHLPLQFAFRTTVQAATGVTTFFMATGTEAHLPTNVVNSCVPTADNFFSDYDTRIKTARNALYRAQERLYRNLLSEHSASSAVFDVGDL
eukprot:2652883-Rhodomonas_salina.1